MSTSAAKLNSLQALRALAAVLVTIAHASEEAKYFFHFQPPFDTDPFGKGVDLFFVLSGFIIFYASHKQVTAGALTPGQFLLQRFIRVAPLYYLFTSLLVLVLVAFPAGVKEARLDWLQILTSYVFLPYERYDGRIAPILSLGWTLNYEIFFYALFALCLAFRAHIAALTTTALILALALLGAAVPEHYPAPIREWTDGIILEFGYGVLIAYVFEKTGKLHASWWLSVLAASCCLGLLYWLNLPEKPFALPRFLSAGLPAAGVLMAFVFLMPDRLERKVPRWIVALGDSSYSLYLSHRFIQRPVQILFKRSGMNGSEYAGGLYVAFAVVMAFVVGYLVFRYIEQPLLRVTRRALAIDKPARPSTMTSHAPLAPNMTR